MAKLTDKKDKRRWPSVEEVRESSRQEYLANPSEYFREQYLCRPRLENEAGQKD